MASWTSPRAIARLRGRALALFVLTLTFGIGLPSAYAVCRVIEPLGDTDEHGVVFDPSTSVLVVQARQTIDYRCPEDALMGGDLAPERREDRRVCTDGEPATPVEGDLTHVVVQPSVLALGGRAGLVMPIPRRADVNEGPHDLFRSLQERMQIEVHETLEFVEDSSLGYQCSDPHYARAEVPAALMAPFSLYGCSDEGYYRPGLEGERTSEIEYSDGDTVEFETITVSDDYAVTVLSASTLEALTAWMDERSLEHDEVDDAAFARYVGEGRWFAALEVTPQNLDGEELALAPLVVTYRGHDFPITHELSYDPIGGVIETDLFVLAPTRMHVEDGDARVQYAAPFAYDEFMDADLIGFGLESGWLTRLHLERNMSDALQMDSVLVEDPSEEQIVQRLERMTRVRIAAACCPGNTIPDRSAAGRTFTEERTYVLSEAPDDSTLFYDSGPQDPAFCSGGASYDEPSYDEGYACALTGAAASWSPLIMALFLAFRRKRHLRNARR